MTFSSPLFSIFVYLYVLFFLFFFNDTATTEIYTLSLHDALPISPPPLPPNSPVPRSPARGWSVVPAPGPGGERPLRPSARRVRVLDAVRGQPPRRSGGPGRRARHDGTGAHRPRRALRCGEVRPRLPVGRRAADLRRGPGDRPGRGHHAGDGPGLSGRGRDAAPTADVRPAGACPRWDQPRP